MAWLSIILTIGFILTLFFYIRKHRSLFTLFRIGGIFLTLLLITNLSLRFHLIKRPKDLLILLDVSESMEGEKMNQAEKIVNKFSSAGKNFKMIPFAESVGIGKKELKRKRTDIAQALRFAIAKSPGAIILISDGLHNSEESPIKEAEKSTVPIFTVATGREKGKDLAITDCLYPEVLNEGESLKIRVVIQATNLPGERNLSLKKDGIVVEKKKIIFSGGEFYKEEEFTILPERGHYFVALESVPGEDDYSNNHFPLSFTIREKKKRIYYISNSPTYNFRFIRDILSENKDNEFNAIISFDGRNFFRLVGEGRERVERFDLPPDAIVILDNIRFSLLPPGFKEVFRNISLNGKGVLFLSGEEDYRDMADWLPFLSEGKVIQKEIEGTIEKEMTNSALFFPEGENLLENCPPFFGMIKSRIKPEAQVWLNSPDGPLVGYWRYRDKKIVQVVGFPLWRWFFSEDENLARRKEFLEKLFDFFLFGERRLYLKTNKGQYFSGENIRASLFAWDEIGRPLKNLSVNLITDETKIPMIEASDGIYEANLFLPPGEHILRAVSEREGEKVGEAERKVFVAERSIEFLRSGIDKELLSAIAQVSGGQFFFADSILNREEIPPFQPREYKREVRFIPRQILPLYFLIISLFILEWLLRKTKGLP
uniref:VWA domain-containing protein n=1 Tax=candidate division WOR-3 bacterium TaxID=2052148 RepID=A0A7C3UPA9_UNCW3